MICGETSDWKQPTQILELEAKNPFMPFCDVGIEIKGRISSHSNYRDSYSFHKCLG